MYIFFHTDSDGLCYFWKLTANFQFLLSDKNPFKVILVILINAFCYKIYFIKENQRVIMYKQSYTDIQ